MAGLQLSRAIVAGLRKGRFRGLGRVDLAFILAAVYKFVWLPKPLARTSP